MQRRLPRGLAALALSLPLLAAATPCLWDRDTLEQERARFPSALELLTGHFPRHSEAYYRWRIEDREKRRTAGDSSPQLLDDLAVAWSKLGEHDRAVELMAEKEEAHPGLYETQANLGTFHIHAGRYALGADHIARAIEINPEAHFGREIYQELLVRYVLERQGEAERPPLPLQAGSPSFFGDGNPNFWNFVKARRGTPEGEEADEAARAVKGVLGMMRFGHHDSPILCEALSDLLLADWDTDAKRLAARALLLASYRVEGEEPAKAYREKAREALLEQTPTPRTSRGMKPEEIESRLREELATAEAWYAELVENERRWIEAGEDVDARYSETYFREDGAPRVELPGAPSKSKGPSKMLVVGLAGSLGLTLSAYALRRLRSA